ncbi:SDR family NAD(P)-dependent oxidoreductase [Chitinophaga sp. 22308]|uniref:SDR family NAD(P)-dependent oxidoreductase n=1 Tax=Chitinophaga sp. 22308 TaxID=3453906 RepID=UPI003F854BD7
MKLPLLKLDPDAAFEQYGIDSVLIHKLTNRLEASFGKLPRTLFFEYQTLRELADYFAAHHAAKLSALTGVVNSREELPVTPLATSPSVSRAAGSKDIAIVGLSGRYPGARNIGEFWDNLKAGRDCITEVPADRWDMEACYDPQKGKAGKSYSKWGGFVADVDKFDPLFFNISPREAHYMDPQERLFLEAVWEALEDGGYTRSRLRLLDGLVSVYAGVMYEEYQLYGVEESLKGNPVNIAGNPANIANRVSYFLNLHGASMSVDTMCSSSLTAIHLGCRALQSGDAALVIAGGVNVTVHPHKYLMLSEGGFVSSQGRCASFGEGGEGYVPSEGVGVVLLKRLSDAEADGDQIYGVVRGSSINHGGKTNGYTVPNPKAQSSVIMAAMNEAGVSAEQISYVEAHGTGTSLGDPVEIAGLSRAFETGKKQYCSIGSVKSNIGHCESAAGVSGLTKVLLQLRHRQLVPSLHSQTLNPHIDFEGSPFKVQQVLAPWASGSGSLRLAGISSFGAGGSNAHLIVSEYTDRRPAGKVSGAVLFVLSARNRGRLQAYAQRLHAYLAKAEGISLHDVGYTLQTGREAMDERLAVVVKDVPSLLAQLEKYISGEPGEYYHDNCRKEKEESVAAGMLSIQDLAMAGQSWVKGATINWQELYSAGHKPRQISLPTYPFEQKRYWYNLRLHANKQEPGPPQQKQNRIVLAPPGHVQRAAVTAAAARISLEPLVTEKEQAMARPIITLTSEQDMITEKIYDAPQVLQQLSSLLADALYIESTQFDRDEKFIDLGLDSIIGVELLQKVNNCFHTDISVTDLYNYPTLNTLGAYIYSQLPNAVAVPEKEQADEQYISSRQTAVKNEIPEILRQLLADALYIAPEQINDDEKLIDMGLDSIIGVELVKNMNEQLGLHIEATDLYNYPTLRELAAYISTLPPHAANPSTIPDTPALPETSPIAGRQDKQETPKSQPVVVTSDIAIIGMSARMPGAASADIFWEHLKAGKDMVTEVPEERWRQSSYYHPDPAESGMSYSRWMGILDDIDRFDPLFFNISPKEATFMDPQQRLFLEECWKTIEDAGYDPKQLANRACGVYIGAGYGDYHKRIGFSNNDLAYLLTGNSSAILSARIAYLLNLKGPSLSIDTACSSSLVAIAHACDGLLLGNCDMAFAGGVCVLTTPDMHIMTSKAGMLSPEGKCKTFDQQADGFVPAEAIGVVLLKRLDQAEKDGDRIHGVIKGWAVNQDGATNGIMAPSDKSQTALQRHVYDKFKIHPETITYVEAHGTGTKLGDPIEVKALKEAFKTYTSKTGFCGLGSVKSNIGHSLAAAGVASVIKVVQALKHKQIPPTIHYTTLNEHISLEQTPFYINTSLKDWVIQHPGLRRAAINSFGFSGTNAHMVIEEYPARHVTVANTSPAIIVLSAQHPDRLREMAGNLLQHLKDYPHLELHEIGFTLQTGRAALVERLAFVVKSREELLTRLEGYITGGTGEIFTGNVRKDKIDFLLEGIAGKAYIEAALKAKELKSLARLWVKGGDFNWHLLYDGKLPAKVGLPAYSFARESYWYDETAPSAEPSRADYPKTEISQQQRYTNVYSGQETFLTDHIVLGEKIFPGAAYLELAREAASHTTGRQITQLKDIVWMRPMTINGVGAKVDTVLTRTGTEWCYQVLRTNGHGEEMHSQGRIGTAMLSLPGSHDPEIIRRRLPRVMQKRECYNWFSEKGLHYGDSFQGITTLYFNETEALSKITLPPSPSFVLTPGMLDSALQTCVCLCTENETQRLPLPYSIREVNIYRELPGDIWCYARKANGNGVAHTFNNFDLDILNEDGEVLLTIRDFAVIPMNTVPQYAANTNACQVAPTVTPATDTAGDHMHTAADLDSRIRELLIMIVCKVLKLQPAQVDPDTPLFEYGIDSILGLNLIKELNEALQTAIPTTILFDYPTINQFAAYLKLEYAASFRDSNPQAVSGPYRQQASEPAGITAQHTGVAGGAGKRLLLQAPGTVADIQLMPFEPMAPRAGEVLVEVKSFALNFGDLLCVKGLYPSMPPYPFTPGFEAAGIVKETGHGVTTFRVGDEVLVAGNKGLGMHATHVTVDCGQLLPKPEKLSFSEACAMPAVSMTVVEAFRRAGLRSGETILVQSATGGTGLIAIQMALHTGASVIATAGSELKLNYLRKLGVSHVINYLEQDFEEEVKKITAGRGVDVLINTLGGENIQKGINCLGKRGRYVELSMTGIKSANKIDLSKFSNNQTFISLDINRLLKDDESYARELWDACQTLIEQHVITPVIGRQFDLQQFRDAYTQLENRSNIGKIVINTQIPGPVVGDYNTDKTREIRPISHMESDIAIIGISGQFGAANNLDEFWDVLKSGTSLIEEVPPERWDVNALYSTNKEDKNKIYCKWGSFLKDIDKFDPRFFRITGVEAETMDPQQRLFLEHCWKALEDAAINPEQLNGSKCGVFVGVGPGDYVQLSMKATTEASAFWGNTSSILASRIAYYLNLKGPAVAVDTACSSSLVAMDIACKSLLLGETDLIISGGVTVYTTPEFYRQSCRAGMLSPHGRCYTFDRRADGFVPGEGVGVVVMKRLKDAERDKDHIYGVIKGILTNQDGTTSGITAPSTTSQKNLETALYNRYNIDPATISYVEAHGTGTSLGDPIEFQALSAAFGQFTGKKQYCGLGSVKSNIGHTVMAAGVSGVLKVLLALKHRQLPPTINFEACNTLISLEDSPFRIQDRLTSWEAPDGLPRRAAVSSFGFSGTNAHVVIEEYVAPDTGRRFSGPVILPLSARNADRLRKLAENLKQYVEKFPALELHDIAYTLQIGRKAMEERLAIVATDKETLVAVLTAYVKGDTHHLLTGNIRKNATPGGVESGTVKALVDRHMRYRELNALAELWVQGATVRWEQLYAQQLPARISLPAYPFARERYWLAAADNAAQPVIPAAAKEKETAEILCFVPEWEHVATQSAGQLSGNGVHVVLPGGADRPFTEKLEAILQQRGLPVVVQQTAEILPDGTTDVYLLHGLNKDTTVIGDQERQFFMAVKQLLFSGYRDRKLNLTIVIAHTQQILAADKVSVTGSGITGLAGSLAKEQPLWRVRVIDIENDNDITALPDTPYHKDGTVCGYRNGAYYERKLRTIKAGNTGKSRFRQNGTYVILGGAGGLGRETTAYLIRKHNARVIWLGRRAQDEQISRWQDTVSVSGNRPVYIQCDATDRADMEHAYAAIKSAYGPVHGLIHSAIVLNDKLLKDMSDQDFEGPFTVKASSSHYLVETFRNEPLDFICFYSSAQSQWNAAGQSNYSAGCSYKDSYAHAVSHQLPIPVYIINWGYWGEVGIVSSSDYQRRMAFMGVESISSAEGMALLEAVLEGNTRQVIYAKLTAAARAMLPLITTKTEKVLPELSLPPVPPYHPATEVEQPFEAICAKGLLQVFLEFGLQTEQPAEIATKYHRLFKVLIGFLVDRGYLEKKGSALVIPEAIQNSLSGFNVAASIDALTATHTSYTPHSKLLKACLGAFGAILTGKARATDVIFPGGSMEHVSGIYKGNYQSDYFNDVLSEVVLSRVKDISDHLAGGEKVRILEVGAGTGGSSEVIFRKLRAYSDQVEYVYTDISRSFLLHAEAHYRELAPYLKTAVLNIESPVAGQAQPIEYYDIVIGSNVVHATRNIYRTLNNIRPLLKKNGLLLLNEIVTTNLFTTLTFGLLDGWWLYEDETLRMEGSPCLSSGSWAAVLAKSGFGQVSFHPSVSGLPQQIIAAVNSGQTEINAHEAPPVSANVARAPQAPVSPPAGQQHNEWLTAQLLAIASATIKIPQADLDVNEHFMDYGFDSILANTFIRNVNEVLKITLTPSDIYNNTNIVDLAGFIQTSYGETLNRPAECNPDKEPADDVPVVPEILHYPLSEAQKGLWYNQEMDAGNFVYNIPLAFTFTGQANKDQLVYAYRLMLHEHPILRAGFGIDEETGAVCQKINMVEDALFVDFVEIDEQHDVSVEFNRLLKMPFNLRQDTPVRFYIRQDKMSKQMYLLFVFHHIVFDGMSGGVFMRSFLEKCQKLHSGGIVIPRDEDRAFFSFVEDERLFMKSERGGLSLAYWREKLSGTLPVLSLPFDTVASTAGTGYSEKLVSPEMSQELRSLSKKLNVSLSSLMLSTFTLLLYKITGEEDILTLMPVANRPGKQHESAIGFYVNMMIVRNSAPGDKIFAAFVDDVKNGVVSGFDHIGYPFTSLVSALQLGGGQGKLPLFRTTYNFQNIYDNVLKMQNGPEEVKMMNGFLQETESEYTMEVFDLKKTLCLRLKYDRSLFLPSTVETHLTYFTNLLTAVLEDSSKKLKEYDILSPEMREQLLAGYYQASDYDENETFTGLFEKQFGHSTEV